MIPVHAAVVKNIKTVMDTESAKMVLEPYIEQTLLRPDASKEEIQEICHSATEHKFHAVCIPPYYVRFARETIKDHNLKIVTVVGFPLGYQTITTKVEEAKRAIQDGADEIDMVMNLAAFKSREYNYVKEELENLVTLCRLKAKILKVIIETGILTQDEIIKICEICSEVKVDFVKTSSGFTGSGVKLEDVKLLRSILPEKIKIKASGGITHRKFAEKLIRAGAARLGTSHGETIINE
jgi:deoxyribose-phosphate aldolase